MRQVITSILKAIGSANIAVADGRQDGKPAIGKPMVQLDLEQLRYVVGGDDGNLPKGGWIVASSTL
jgi:hypothetical protein